ncbi:MAG: hypothetical protein ACKVLN_08400 [Rhodobacterales bacterium]|jgi:hypothetical protein
MWTAEYPGTRDLENFQFTFIENPTINAQITRQMLEKLEHYNSEMATIRVFLDSAR